MTTIKGFNNIGNTCYLNSGLQMLIQNTDFCKIIMENRDLTENLKVVATFIEEYYLSENKSISPVHIKNMVGNKNRIFKGSNQQDAGEFIIYLLDILNDDLKGQLNRIFQFKTKTTIKCKLKTCLTYSIKEEYNNYLITSINSDSNDLDDCYRNFKVHEKLEGSEMYFCEKCQAKRVASRRLEVIDWNKHLIISLKRFENNNGRLSKNNKEINIPIDWRHDYTIKGAVIHSGGIGGGHYVYISRNIDNNTWTMCDDSSTYLIRSEQVQNYLNRAYIFHYVRKV